jgi:hypothetical protein
MSDEGDGKDGIEGALGCSREIERETTEIGREGML